ncbi:hypothetical protein D3C74_375240 [compost metagenome]
MPSCSAQKAMPSRETYPSSDCTRCSMGSSAERFCGYRAMIAAVSCARRAYVASSYPDL